MGVKGIQDYFKKNMDGMAFLWIMNTKAKEVVLFLLFEDTLLQKKILRAYLSNIMSLKNLIY